MAQCGPPSGRAVFVLGPTRDRTLAGVDPTMEGMRPRSGGNSTRSALPAHALSTRGVEKSFPTVGSAGPADRCLAKKVEAASPPLIPNDKRQDAASTFQAAKRWLHQGAQASRLRCFQLKTESLSRVFETALRQHCPLRAACAARSEPPQLALTRVGKDLRAEQVGHRRIREM